MDENRHRHTVWMDDNVWVHVESHYQRDNCTTKNEFIEKAVRFYSGYLDAESAAAYLLRALSDVLEGKKNFYCSNRECQFAMWKDDRFFTSKHKELTKPMVAALLKNGRIKMKGLFSEKKGVLYDAVVVLADTGDKYVNYKLELPPRQNKNGKE